MPALTISRPSTAARVGGVTYIAASIGFLAVFSWLAVHFGYPGVLDRPAAEVLPRLLALGTTGRVVWMVYAMLPLLLIGAANGAAEGLRRDDGRTNVALRLGVVLQTLAALAMTLGLARWSTAQWILAEAWPRADAAQQLSIATLFDVLNSYLGHAIGEFTGELALYGSFAAFGHALRGVGARRMGIFAGITALAGLVAAFRNITPLVQPASDAANLLLPAFLIMLGVWLVRGKHPAA